MNLELIKKYEKEFLHMLHGGTLLFHSSYHGGWYTLPGDCQWDDDYGFVINDEYVEFRKALVAGKTIEERYYTPTDHWGKHLSGFAISPKMLRIKPEEPELKVGDWITVNGPAGAFIECISGINDDTYVLSGTNICYKSQATKWEPREGDLCVVWDNDDICSAAIVRNDYIDTAGQYTTTDNSWWDNCMPFTGTLPPHMKDNK